MRTTTTSVILYFHSLLMPLVFSQTPPGYWLSPETLLEVTFPGQWSFIEGQELNPTDAQSQPLLRLSQGLCMLEKYLVIMIDVESVRCGVARTMLHWYQPNLEVVPGTTGALELKPAKTKQAAAAYIGPQPLPGSPHQYLIMVFRQPSDFEFPRCFESILPATVDARAGFDLKQFMGVARLSYPVAANYFVAQSAERPAQRPPPATSTWKSHAPCPAETGPLSDPYIAW